MKELKNFRGVKNVQMITVLEGNGKEDPYQEVRYIVDDDFILGKIEPCEVS